MGRRFNSHQNDAGSMLAAVFILTLGTGGCLFTVAAMSPNSVPMAAGIMGAVILAFIAFLVFQRFGKVPNADLSFLLKSRRNKRDDGLGDYTPRVANQRQTGNSGGNRPITAEEAHEIRISSASTWVPATGRKPKSD